MQREEEKERRRLRDRQRRQSMTQEQRERHLARRRRNYQLRRQRAANAFANVNVPFSPLTPQPQPQPHFPHSSTGEDSSTAELQWATSSSDHTILTHVHNLGQGTSEIVEGSSIQPEGLPRRLRLSGIKHLARNLMSPSSGPTGNHQVAAQLLPKADVSGGDGCTPKPFRLIRVKHLARSISTPSEETAAQKNQNVTVEGKLCIKTIRSRVRIVV